MNTKLILSFMLGILIISPCVNAAKEDSPIAMLEARISVLEARIDVLEGLLEHVSVNGNDVYIQGANLHITNGSGATDTGPNGLGNLIIGYNEEREEWDNIRTGSHNLVVGTRLNYSSYGGIVAGNWSENNGPWSTVLGYFNMTLGDSSVVSGGQFNVAEAANSSVSGGYDNLASGYSSSVSGGNMREASGPDDWVAGSLWEDG